MTTKKVLLDVDKEQRYKQYLHIDKETGHDVGIETEFHNRGLLERTKVERDIVAGGYEGPFPGMRPIANVPQFIMNKAIKEGWTKEDWRKKFIDNPDYAYFRIDK